MGIQQLTARLAELEAEAERHRAAKERLDKEIENEKRRIREHLGIQNNSGPGHSWNFDF